MRKYRKWMIAAMILLLIAALVWFAGRYTIPLPYFLSGSMEQYLLEIPEGENAKELILSNCEVTSAETIGETECKKYSYDETAFQSLLPEGATMYQLESGNAMVYLSYTLPNNVVVTLAYDDLGWNHTIVKYEKSEWMFSCTRDSFKLYTPWVRSVS